MSGGKELHVDEAKQTEPPASAFDAVNAVGLQLPGVEAATNYDGSPMLKAGGSFMAGMPTHPSAEPDTLVVRAHAAPTPFLHVANGTDTTRLIESAGIAGTVSIWADPLYDGPVPGGLSDAELVEVRTHHLAGPAAEADVDPVNDLRNWRAAIERHESYGELILWFEHDLFDQLNLLQLLTWIRERLPPATPSSLICVGTFPGHPRFKGLGELSPGELASLLETRQGVSDEEYALANRAWEAFRAPTPEPLDALCRDDTRALPYLAPAVTRFLQEYPWTTDGLSRTERRLLQLAADKSIDLASAFPRMQDGEDAYSITDRSLADLADALAHTSPPLVALTPGRNGGRRSLQGSVTLTDVGRAVLAGRSDRVATCGIDRWFGGTHLRRGRKVWRWDPQRQRVTAGS